MKPRLSSIALAWSLALLAGGCRPFSPPDIPGKVLASEGTATVTRAGQQFSLAEDSLIHPGDVIGSPTGGRLALLLVPGVLVELAGGSEIEVIQLRLQVDGNENIRPVTARDATIRLRRGRLFASVAEPQTEPRLVILTNAGTLTAGAAQAFEITATGDRAELFCVRGDTDFQATGAAAASTVSQGYSCGFPVNGRAPVAAASAGAKAQARVRELLEREKRLLRLGAERGFQPRPRP